MLPARTAKTLSANLVAKTLVAVYGVTALAADPIHIEWAVAHLLGNRDRHNLFDIVIALREVNRIRVRQGRMPAYPVYGSPLFGL